MHRNLALMPASKSVEDAISDAVSAFLGRFLDRYFRNAPGARYPHNQTEAAAALGISQGYLSDIVNRRPGKKAGLSLVVALREATGASFEDITSHRVPRRPKYPLAGPVEELAQAERAVRMMTHEAGRALDAGPKRIKRPSEKP